MNNYMPEDHFGTDLQERLASKEAQVLVQRIVKNSKEALEKIRGAQERIAKAAAEFRKV